LTMRLFNARLSVSLSTIHKQMLNISLKTVETHRENQVFDPATLRFFRCASRIVPPRISGFLPLCLVVLLIACTLNLA